MNKEFGSLLDLQQPARGDVGGRVFFPDLDALRFFAFLLVYLQHAFGRVVAPSSLGDERSRSLAAGLFASGDIGVSFFFVLSGFLITFLILKEVELAGSIDVTSFYARRALRIWPLYFVVLSIGLLIAAQAEPRIVGAKESLWFAVFLGNFPLFAGLPAPLCLSITWSVAIEEQFYIAWPQLLRRVGTRLCLRWFAALIAASLLFRLYRHGEPAIHLHTLNAVPYLAVGGAMAFLSIKAPSFREAVEGMTRATIAAAYALGLLAVLLRDHVHYRSQSPWLQDVLLLCFAIQPLILALFFAFIIAEQNWAARSLVKASRFRPATLLGRYSYGLYLWHPIALMLASVVLGLPPLDSYVTGAGDPTKPVAFLRGVLGFPLAIGISCVSYHLLEAPFLLIKRKFAQVRSGAEANGF